MGEKSGPSIRKRTLGPLAVVLLVAAGTVAFFTGRDRVTGFQLARLSGDSSYYYAYLPSLVLDRDLDLDDEYKKTKNPYQLRKTETGKRSNVFGIGPALFALPFFLFGRALAAWKGAEDHGFTVYEIKATLYASFVASALAAAFAARLVRRRLGASAGTAGAAAVLVACGGPVVYYAIRQPGYGHPFATLFVAWLVDRWDASYPGAAPRGARTWAALGALFGLSVLARPQLALWGVLLVAAALDDVARSRGIVAAAREEAVARGRSIVAAALDDVARSRRIVAAAREEAVARGRSIVAAVSEHVRRLAPPWLLGALVAFVAFSPQLVTWKILYGRFFLVPQGEGFMRWDAPAWSETLFSSRNGLFPWAPLYALAALGLIASLARTPRISAALIAGVAAQSIANGAVWDWWAGGSFGGRRFDSCYVAFTYGLGFLLTEPMRLWRGESRSRGGLRRVATALIATLAVALAAGNVAYAWRKTWRTVRILGGQPAWIELRKKLPGLAGYLYGEASRLANWPARAAFGIRTGFPSWRYDWVVGAHVLPELYPGLNTVPQPRQHVYWLAPSSAFLFGFGPSNVGSVALREERARVLVPLNLRGAIRLRVLASTQRPGETAPLALRWNGVLLGGGDVDRSPTELVAVVDARRGLNVAELESRPGLAIHRIAVETIDAP